MRRPYFALCLSGLIAMIGGWPAQGLTEDELQALYLGVVEDAVTVFEPIWHDDSARIPDSGYYDFSMYANWRDDAYAGNILVPGNGQVLFCYAVLLTQTDRETFADGGTSREHLRGRIRQALRWIALTNAHAETPYDFVEYGQGGYMRGRQWTRTPGVRTDMQGWLTVALALIRDELDAETLGLVKTALLGEAWPEYEQFTWTEREGGLHDLVKHRLSSLIAAAFLFPDTDEGRRSMDYVRQSGIDIVSTRHDFANAAAVEGKPVRDWANVWNLYEDYSSDHHGHAQVWYGCDLVFEARTYLALLSALTGVPTPETFAYPANGFNGVLEWVKRITLPEGEPAPAHGAEYDSYYGAGLLAACYGALLNHDAVAAAFEDQSALLLRRQSQVVRQYDYHRNSWAKAAAAYLMHRHYGPRVAPLPRAEALAALEGTYHHHSHMEFVQRAPDKYVSWSWGIVPGRNPEGHCGFMVPALVDIAEDAAPTPFVYLHPDSMTGRVRTDWLNCPGNAQPAARYTASMTDTHFHTAGVRETPRLDQFRAFYSFAEGPCALATRFEAHETGDFHWTGLPIYFYAREGITNVRTLHDAEGAAELRAPLERQSNWWCVDDRLGMVVVGGNDTLAVERSAGFNWARQPEYRDQCDAVIASPIPETALVPGDVPVDLWTVVYANTPHEAIAAAAQDTTRIDGELPDGWVGLVTRDAAFPAKRYVLLANFQGTANQACLRLTFPEGAPILGTPTAITGATACSVVECRPLESAAEVLDLYARVDGAAVVEARRETRNRYRAIARGLSAHVVFRCAVDAASVSAHMQDAHGDAVAVEVIRDGQAFAATLPADTAVLIEVAGDGPEDCVAPAVEIERFEALPDGRVNVFVRAGDSSGLEYVELVADGTSVGTKRRPPWAWTLWPDAGAHTFQAVAVDASPRQNRRTSFLRTVDIAPGQPG
ncbi:MAG TPA: hypothetical protein PLO37_19315 [Candidatus Hydrogenedentes bacterium]|nr:hypothetical protein [Candidatus Hydrogenedentota bacterium]HPG69002.1 hypothetical protein [Candidatus Hydrogenedentota bacterium]